MTGRGRRRGFFEGPPRVLYRRVGARYMDACAAAVVVNGVLVSGFGIVTLVLYVDVHAGELAVFAACSAAWYAVEGLVAAVSVCRADAAVRGWLRGERGGGGGARAWAAAARLPLVLLRRPGLYAIGAVGAAAVGLVLAALLGLPAAEAALLFPASYLLYLYSAVLRYLGLELMMRPLLEAIGERLPVASPPGAARVSLHRRLLATVPMVNWGAGVVVAGLLTANTRDLDTIGLASILAIPVTAVLSIWLSLMLARPVSTPIKVSHADI